MAGPHLTPNNICALLITVLDPFHTDVAAPAPDAPAPDAAPDVAAADPDAAAPDAADPDVDDSEASAHGHASRCISSETRGQTLTAFSHFRGRAER